MTETETRRSGPAAAPVGAHTPLMRTVRDQNVSAILRHLMAAGPTSRKQLGQATGLSSTTVTKLAGSLIGAGLVVEVRTRSEPTRVPPPRAGRPEQPLALVKGQRYVVGTRIRTRSVTSKVFDITGDPIAEATVPFRSAQPTTVIAAAFRATTRVLAEVESRCVLGVGLSIGGIVDNDRGVVTYNPLLGWRDVDLQTPFHQLGFPVLVDSSMRSLAVRALWGPEGLDADSILTVFVANVIGSALIVGRHLHRGPGAFAGAIEHFPTRAGYGVVCECGAVDCLGVVATNLAVLRRGVELKLVPADTTWGDVAGEQPTVGALAPLLLARARLVGEAMGQLSTFFNPDVTVLTGYLGAQREIDECLTVARRRADVTMKGGGGRIIHLPAPEDEWDRASAALVLDDFLRQPTRYEASLLL